MALRGGSRQPALFLTSQPSHSAQEHRAQVPPLPLLSVPRLLSSAVLTFRQFVPEKVGIWSFNVIRTRTHTKINIHTIESIQGFFYTCIMQTYSWERSRTIILSPSWNWACGDVCLGVEAGRGALIWPQCPRPVTPVSSSCLSPVSGVVVVGWRLSVSGVYCRCAGRLFSTLTCRIE